MVRPWTCRCQWKTHSFWRRHGPAVRAFSQNFRESDRDTMLNADEHLKSSSTRQTCSGVESGAGRHKYLCPVFLVCGCLCVVLGFVGAVLPGMPTTVFLIMAVWCFSKSSNRFRVWLLNHPRFGPSLRAWHEDRCIPVHGKVCAITSMAVSLFVTAVFVANSWTLPLIMFVCMTPVAAWIVSRPSAPATT